MKWAVKLDKPDFLGKRALMRISAKGPKQRLVGFKVAHPGVVPDEGLQIVAPIVEQAASPDRRSGRTAPPTTKLEIIGWVTSSRFSPTLGEAIGLCWLPADMAAQNGTPCTIRVNGTLEEARVHHGAFYDPEGERLRI
jgi:sarcosine oxidase subunit alpha